MGRAILPHRICFSKYYFSIPIHLPRAKSSGPQTKQMEVIGHDDVAADSNVMVGICPFRELSERMCDRICRQHWSSPICASRYKKNRIARKERGKPRWNAGIFVHLGAGYNMMLVPDATLVPALRIAKRLQKRPSHLIS